MDIKKLTILSSSKRIVKKQGFNEKCELIFLKFILRQYSYMEQKPEQEQQQKERIAKFKPWKLNSCE